MTDETPWLPIELPPYDKQLGEINQIEADWANHLNGARFDHKITLRQMRFLLDMLRVYGTQVSKDAWDKLDDED